jgi:large subunit ribosomal protein L5
MQVPNLVKVVLNMGLGNAKDNANGLKQSIEELTIITGQKPVVNKAKKAISNFKLREHDPVGVSVTLRRERMYEFLDRFISIAAPRIRDFRGLPNRGFDGRGNYNFGITEQIIFPEIDYDKISQIRGLNVTIVTTAENDEIAFDLLMEIGMPIRKKVVQVEEEVAA